MLPLAARRADIVLTDSESSAIDLRRFLRLPAEHVHAIPLAGEGRLTPAHPSVVAEALTRYEVRQPYLLYVGGLNGRKNIEGLLAAFAEVRRSHPRLALVIAGKRQWRVGGIDKVLQNLDIEAQVHFTGYVADADLPGLYGGAAAFVFPSLYEGFGLPVLEAMACGAPVITSNVSSLPEVAGDAALLIDPRNSGAIATAIRRVLEDPHVASTLRLRGLARAAEFTWERTARETLAIYERLLGQTTFTSACSPG
jgi:glycosyltransferase involved in cell wall biosynthesis